MAWILLISIVIIAVVLLYRLLNPVKEKPAEDFVFPKAYKEILQNDVPYYQQLDAANKAKFERRVQEFLSGVTITGIKTTVEDIDRVYIAASAIIPIFNFEEWHYINLHEVLLYPDSFDHDFKQQGEGRNILGMVGTGAMNHVMILSQFELRQAFINKTGKENTAIHEFVHLLDKTDGAIDGVPESLLSKKYVLPWLRLVHKEIGLIKDNESDINPYAATNESEFFAVVSEYFFERPELLEQKHPDLYKMLLKIFKPAPPNSSN